MTDRFATLRQGLVGAWCPSLDGVGTVIPDRGNRRNNLSNAAAPNAQRGERGLYVSGSNNALVASNDGAQQALNGATTATITGWMRRLSSSNYVAFGFNGASGTGNRFSTIWFSDGNWYWAVESAGSNYVGVAAYAPTPELWAHCAVTFNGSLGSGNRSRFFINGVSVGAVQSGFEPATLSTALGPLVLGRDFSTRLSGSAGAGGWINDVRVYNRVLTLREIRSLASQQGIGLTPTRHRRARLAAAATTLWLNVGGVWKTTTPHIRVGGVWKQSTPKIRVSGEWKG